MILADCEMPTMQCTRMSLTLLCLGINTQTDFRVCWTFFAHCLLFPAIESFLEDPETAVLQTAHN
jgi:hypothetical protein